MSWPEPRLIAVVLLFVAHGAWAQQLIELSAGIHRIRAEVANNSRSRAEGLMYRKALEANSGMLFVFDQTAHHCMWMRNTLIPLAVAFLDETGRVINIEEMLPQTENNHCATKPAKFALEMASGWFGSRGVGNGARLSGIERAPPAR